VTAKGEVTWTYNSAGALTLIRCWAEHLVERRRSCGLLMAAGTHSRPTTRKSSTGRDTCSSMSCRLLAVGPTRCPPASESPWHDYLNTTFAMKGTWARVHLISKGAMPTEASSQTGKFAHPATAKGLKLRARLRAAEA
jgi:hypothetical protein